MKHWLLVSIPILSSFGHVVAQSVFDKILNQSCECLEKQNLGQIGTDSLEIKTDSCISQAIVYNISALLAEGTVDLDSDESMQQLGVELAELFFKDCEAFRTYSMRYALQQTQIQQESYQRDTGQLVDVESRGSYNFLYLWQGEREVEYLWLREFDGSSRFFPKARDSMRSKRVEILWDEIEVYDRNTESYNRYKEIKLIEELETVPRLSKQLCRQLEKARKKK